MILPIVLFTIVTSVANAQLADFINRVVGGTTQQPLVSDESVVETHTRVLNSENWRNAVSVPIDDAASPEDSQEWLFYFTGKNSTKSRNITFWDGVYKDTIYSLSTAKPPAPLHFATVNCSIPESADLCHSFFLAEPYIPVFYHFASYPINGSTEIRKVPWNRNITEAEQHVYLARFHTEKLWRDVQPWISVLNPIDGQLKDFTPYLGLALKYYEMLPQWAFMIIISFVGRQVSSRMVGRVNQGRAA
ncbi:hypothetical protein EDC01DRAFT_628480 [Geopyxis carbonaria]|nr:hypothetical protein EDC01DRAFT_628480 [Geopyxis carbonaria]